jgi:hypothetical protein
LLDLGKINFNRNTGSYHLSAASAVFNNWHEASFADNKQVDQTLSAVFYNGDSSHSQTGTSFHETQWFEVSLPMSLIYYNHWQSRMGVAVRVGYFFFGGDALGGLVKINNLQQADVYAGIHYFVPEKSKHTVNNF